MIYEALIAPHESPTSMRDIKRALLTYDKVKLIDPDDRDVIPGTTLMVALGIPPVIGMNMGPIRPMGKTQGYDDNFQKIYDSCKPAFQQDLIQVVSTYNKDEIEGITIGSVQTGGYPLNVQFVFQLYRNMSQDQEFLQTAIATNKTHLLSNMDIEGDISLEGSGDGRIMNGPVLPLLEDPALNDDQSKFITQIARARIASLIKYSGFCETKNLVPLFPSDVYGGAVSRLLKNAQMALEETGVEEDRYWRKRNRVLELCHEEFLDDARLDLLSIEEVIKLRSKGWGRQAEAREALFDSVRSIAQNVDDNADFENRVKAQITDYKTLSDEVLTERKKFNASIACDIGKAGFMSIPVATGVLSQYPTPFASIEVILAVGGAWVMNKAKEHAPNWIEIKAKEKTMKRGAGFGLHNFYSRINNAS